MSRARGDGRRQSSWWPPAQARRDVDGGVAVPRPGKVSWDRAQALIADAESEAASPGILSRGRTYARAGQVVAVQVDTQQFTAEIQGSADEPYEVALRAVTISGSDRTDASCNCPYGCDFGWCKHAAALAYVAAHLLDTDLSCRAAWLGTKPAQPQSSQCAPPPEILLARLSQRCAPSDPETMLAMATAIVPLPAGLAVSPSAKAADQPKVPDAQTAPALAAASASGPFGKDRPGRD